MASTVPELVKGKVNSGDEWVVVIKVKYGDNLRRFGAHVYQKLMVIEYNMNKLRAKISNLFEFNKDAVMILTYTDEDNELVTLDNDDELLDAVICQRINPLRINVNLQTQSVGGSESSRKAESSDTRSERSTHTHHGFPHIELNSAVKEALKPVPQPFRGVLTNISHHVLETASRTPAFVDLLLQLLNKHVSNASSSREALDNPSGDGHLGSNHLQQQPENIEKMHPKESYVVHSNSNNSPSFFIARSPSKSQCGSTYQADAIRNTVASATAFPCHSPQLKPCPQLCRSPQCMPYTFHRGVICDGCGMHPILGTRYVSTVKEDYDLCSTCFSDVDSKNEYFRIDWSGYQFPKDGSQSPSTLSFDGRKKAPIPKLKSCFIQDVTIRDGTVLHPCSRFTKIWRMRNNGTIAWPFGTRLVWVDGDHLGENDSVQLKIPESGFPVDEELDIAVDIVTPSLPARYVSYWQLASPSRHKFGEQVWVVVLVVDAETPSSRRGSHAMLDLNLPPEGSHLSGLGKIDVNAEPVDSVVEAGEIMLHEELLKPIILDTWNLMQQSNDVPNSSSPNSQSSAVSNPSICLSESSTFTSLSNPPEASCSPSHALTEEDQLDQSLLSELHLNKETVRLFDMESLVEDLCGYVEWEPLLKELHEMGFHDKQLNRKLLLKNGGSIKRVVLDLLSEENAEQFL
ncbi:hypothetical protein HPP92_005970 [Vanilla planifolia]|uniref:ZZ-type domain-containing protein n=1 Tax=Vanilla planifolia TaxID=51239 RepID=A0A835RMP7_VANPL|nr:hypothetical protein HPP92_005970 [Vanilla planifolia]